MSNFALTKHTLPLRFACLVLIIVCTAAFTVPAMAETVEVKAFSQLYALAQEQNVTVNVQVIAEEALCEVSIDTDSIDPQLKLKKAVLLQRSENGKLIAERDFECTEEETFSIKVGCEEGSRYYLRLTYADRAEKYLFVIEQKKALNNIAYVAGHSWLVRYLNHAMHEDSVYVLIAANGDASAALTDEEQTALSELGLQEKMKNHPGESYIGVVKIENAAAQLVYENAGGDTLKYSEALTKKCKVKIVSTGVLSEEKTSIKINGEKCLKCQEGINIVIYDYADNEVLDSYTFDTAAGYTIPEEDTDSYEYYTNEAKKIEAAVAHRMDEANYTVITVLSEIPDTLTVSGILVLPVFSDGTSDYGNAVNVSQSDDGCYKAVFSNNGYVGVKLEVDCSAKDTSYSFAYNFFDSVFYETRPSVEFDSGLGDTLYISHALGGIDGQTYLNCYEGFIYNYSTLGQRVFEVDMVETKDNEYALQHSWKDWNKMIGDGEFGNTNPPTLQEFKSYKLNEKYTPLCWLDLCKLMEEYPDIRVITDTKYDQTEDIIREFSYLIETAKENGYEDILDRLIIQIYNEEMLDTIESMYPFKHIIFTMYKRLKDSLDDYVDVCKWCLANGIGDICIEYKKYQSGDIALISKLYGINIYAHTVNDKALARELIHLGAKGIYTDFLYGTVEDLYSEEE